MTTSQGRELHEMGGLLHDATGCHDCLLTVNDAGMPEAERDESRADLVRARNALPAGHPRRAVIGRALAGLTHSQADHESCEE